MYVLDTDHLSLLIWGANEEARALRERLSPVGGEECITTIVTYEEQVRGWLAEVKRAGNSPELVNVYRWLLEHLELFRKIEVLAFDEAAAGAFQNLRGIRIGTMDLRIAAIALSRQATLLSRNLKDFRRVPGLIVEDWTVAPEAGA